MVGISIDIICVGNGIGARHMVGIRSELIGIGIGIELIGVGTLLGTRLVAKQDGDEVAHDL
jgi:hypothetical protein